MALASANLHTGRYGGMCSQFILAFSLEEAPTFGRGSSLDRMSEKISSLYETPNASLSQDKLKHSIIFTHTSGNSIANSPKVFVFSG
jgi:hypothetical protein